MKAYVQEQELTFTIVLDEAGGAANTYQVRGIPTSFFIDRDGVIQVRHTGALDKTLIDRYTEQSLR